MDFWAQKRRIEHLAILPQILHSFFPKVGKKVRKILNYFGEKHAKTWEKKCMNSLEKVEIQGAFLAQCLPSYKLLFSKLVSENLRLRWMRVNVGMRVGWQTHNFGDNNWPAVGTSFEFTVMVFTCWRVLKIFCSQD